MPPPNARRRLGLGEASRAARAADATAYEGARLMMRNPTKIATTLALALSVAAVPVRAQVLQGRLLTAYEDRPIAQGMVRFLTEAGDTVASTPTDADGRFVLAAPGPGRYLVSGEATFHEGLTEGPLELQAGDTIEAELRLQPDALELDPLTAEVEGRSPFLTRSGFYGRAGRGLGRFLTADDIERRNPIYTSDVLGGMPGVLVQQGQTGPPRVYVRQRVSFQGGGWCEPKVYVDDVPQYSETAVNDIRPELIAGIEVYTSQLRVPPAYGGGLTGCGVILIWTRR